MTRSIRRIHPLWSGVCFLVALVAVGVCSPDVAQAGSTPITIGDSMSLQITGFGDLVAKVAEENDGNTFGIGQVEIGLESDLTDAVSFALAIAYDDGAFGIGAFTIDWTAWEREEGASASFAGITNVTVGGGQFDVPFGIDWQVYPSIDRRLVSTPLVVGHTHNCWNDLGGYFSAEATWGKAILFGVNGFCREDHDQTSEESEAASDVALGGRLGLIPLANLEVGGSYALVLGQDATDDMELVGADMQFSIENFTLKGEYIVHRFKGGESNDFSIDGSYLHGVYDIGSWYLVARYGERSREQEGEDKVSRFSGGVGRVVSDQVELRLEYQANSGSVDDAAFFQVAVGF